MYIGTCITILDSNNSIKLDNNLYRELSKYSGPTLNIYHLLKESCLAIFNIKEEERWQALLQEKDHAVHQYIVHIGEARLENGRFFLQGGPAEMLFSSSENHPDSKRGIVFVGCGNAIEIYSERRWSEWNDEMSP